MPTKSHSLSNTFPVDTYPKDPKRKIHTEFIKYCSPPLFFIVGRVGIEPTSRTLIWDPAALHPIELPSEMHHIPKGAPYFSECQINGFSDFSLDWFSGYQQEEDSFYQQPLNVHRDILFRLTCHAATALMAFGKTVPIWFNVGRYHGLCGRGFAPRITPL